MDITQLQSKQVAQLPQRKSAAVISNAIKIRMSILSAITSTRLTCN